MKPVVNNGIRYQPQLVNAGFLNHQQNVSMCVSSFRVHCWNNKQKSAQASKAQVQRGRYQISACQNLSTWWIKFAIPGIQGAVWIAEQTNIAAWKIHHEWTYISYWKRWISIAMLVCWRVMRRFYPSKKWWTRESHLLELSVWVPSLRTMLHPLGSKYHTLTRRFLTGD